MATQPFLELRGKPITCQYQHYSRWTKIEAPRPGDEQGGTEWCFFSTGNRDSEMVAHALRRLFDPLQDRVLRLIRPIGVSAAAGGIACIYVYIYLKRCSEWCIQTDK